MISCTVPTAGKPESSSSLTNGDAGLGHIESQSGSLDSAIIRYKADLRYILASLGSLTLELDTRINLRVSVLQS